MRLDDPPVRVSEPAVSIIIPAIDEAATLAATLRAARAVNCEIEIILVDAGSTDATAEIAKSAGAKVLPTDRRQRAHQLNVGAQHARGSTLLFLHADTRLPEGAADLVTSALQRSRLVGGAFARRYDSPSKMLRATCQLAQLRNQLIGWHLGDQAMFVRRSVFFQLGGFREVDQFEDLDFSRRLGRFGPVVTLVPCVTSSPRRFHRGAVRTTLRDLCLTTAYLFHGLPEVPPAAPVRRPALT